MKGAKKATGLRNDAVPDAVPDEVLARLSTLNAARSFQPHTELPIA